MTDRVVKGRPPMTTSRQLKILHYLAIRDEMEVTQLSEMLTVSPSTIRRDLSAMEKSGLLERIHGAARLPAPIRYEAPYEQRLAHNISEKRSIAMAAKEIIEPGMVIGIMGGSTCTELARLLRPMEHITIVTNAINVSLELQGQINKRIMVTGGVLNPNSYELVGSQAIESLQQVHLSLAFIGVTGITVDYGFSISDESEAAVARAFMQAADRTVVLADWSKIGSMKFARLCPLLDADMLITDCGIMSNNLSEFEQAGLKVLVALVPD